MTLAQLQYFQALAHILHYTRTAEELHIAQPSLSYSINELEKELGVKLFNKEDRKITLTMYGEQFLPYVESALATINDGTEALRQMSGSAMQIIRLGYFHSISASLIPALMKDLYEQTENERLRFQFSEGSSFDLLGLLKKGDLDLTFCMHTDDWIETIPIMKQPLYLAVPQEHPLAERSFVNFADFANEPIILLDKTSSLRIRVDQIFAKEGITPNVLFVVRECNAALQYVSLGFGVSILPQVPAMDNAPVAVLPIADIGRECVRTVYLAWAKNRPLSPAVRRVRYYIVDHYALHTLTDETGEA